jgi:hypothetical protein
LLRAATIVACATVAPAAGAATVKSSFGVSVTVVAECRIAPGQPQVCAAHAPGSPIVAPQPVVRFSRDPKTGVVTRTVEF